MNPFVQNLSEIARKPSRYIIGLMSGTSLDGLDVALCRFHSSGPETEVELLEFTTVPYTEEVKTNVRKVFAKETVHFPFLAMLNPWIGRLHGEMINTCLNKWGVHSTTVDLIASHGQTVMHMPKRLHQNPDFPNATLQIGDGDHVAESTGIITISDFRQKHCAVGGEGAPLALYGDYLLFQNPLEDRVLINIGGIANFTYLPQNGHFKEVFATDTGPGNTMIDAFVQKHYALAYDKNAELALKGTLIPALLDTLLAHDYFQQAVPKTTGPELFNLAYLESALKTLNESPSPEDILHTLAHFSMRALIQEIQKTVPQSPNLTIYLSGGGMHNPLFCRLLEEAFSPEKVKPMDSLGISGDAKEAILFAALANETVAGNKGFARPNHTEESFFMGKISFPS
ncbi:anhydro-N-acetylmuramic acid kinase [Marinilongibacter aquaticus]|uniref:anhydro-N-acetylmuramic acid kinase n=1 Tax=Marinilongibacter aquaticus TaxID=2975157 RepID=UPI0021BD810A|nr:anhydro-N-acetylmuramic acid kinase [Marinilongibacter aquaticus]UBM57488.1 anhydro-N-acetylmuramic acid kinase [Marinilongibacter aquaticus]